LKPRRRRERRCTGGRLAIGTDGTEARAAVELSSFVTRRTIAIPRRKELM
jgi:hypothetical protein